MAKRIDKETGEIIDEVTREPIFHAGYVPDMWKTPWNHDRDAEARNTSCTCKDPSLAQKQFQADADINNILAKFANTGQLTTSGQTPNYGDAPENTELLDNIVTRSQMEAAWNAQPAAVRNILRDPKTFIDYIDHCIQTGDLAPLRELGLAKPLPEPPAPPATPAITPPAPPQGGTTASETLSVGTLANK